MPGFGIWTNPTPGDIGPQVYDLQKVANSVTAYAGDPVVLTTVTGSEARLRVLTSSDITALYSTAANDIVGIAGIARSDFATDSSGNATTVPSTVTLGSMTKPIYNLPSLDAANPPDPATGRFRANFFTAGNIFSGYLWENTTVNGALRTVDVGIQISTITAGVPVFFWSTAATTKIGEIYDVATDDPYFNKTVTANVLNTTHYPRCLLAVRIFPQYQELLNGFSYAT